MTTGKQLKLGAFMRPVSIHTGGLALSRGLSRRQFQLRASEALRADAGARQVRRLLHGRPSGGAQHADGGAEAQPHGDLLRALHAAARRWPAPPSASASSPPPPPPSISPITSRAASPRSTISAAAAPAGTSSPPPTPMPRSISGWRNMSSMTSAIDRAREFYDVVTGPLGQLGRRRLRPRRREPASISTRRSCMCWTTRASICRCAGRSTSRARSRAGR